MSIVPVNAGPDTWEWDPISDLHLWNPFFDFPFPSFIRRASRETQLSWRDTPTAHVLRAYLPGCSIDDVLVFVDDDGMLQITTQNGNFMTRFKLPDDATADQMQGFMENGLLLVTIPKQSAQGQGHPPRNVRVVEITE